MATSSILGGERATARASGRDVDALGPSDTSDSGSDVQGERTMPTQPDNPGEYGALTVDLGSDSDASGTGERASATGRDPIDGADILPDRIASVDSLTDEALDLAVDDEDEDAQSDDEDDAADSISAPKLCDRSCNWCALNWRSWTSRIGGSTVSCAYWQLVLGCQHRQNQGV